MYVPVENENRFMQVVPLQFDRWFKKLTVVSLGKNEISIINSFLVGVTSQLK